MAAKAAPSALVVATRATDGCCGAGNGVPTTRTQRWTPRTTAPRAQRTVTSQSRGCRGCPSDPCHAVTCGCGWSLSSPGRPWRTRGRRSRRRRRRRRRSWRTSWSQSSWSSTFRVTGLRSLVLMAESTSGTATAGGPVGRSRLAPVMG